MSTWRLALVAAVALGSIDAGAQPATDLQTRVDALAQQLELRGATNSVARAAHREQAAAVIDAWNRVPHTVENRVLLEAWLDRAFASLMAGGRSGLPVPPAFSQAVLAEPVPTIAKSPVVTPEPAAAPPIPTTVLPPSTASLPQPDVSNRASAKPVLSEPTRVLPPAPSRSKWSRHPAAAPLEWRDPFRKNPAASPNPLRSGAFHETHRSSFDESSTVRVNLNHLRAEVRGYNAALRELQALVMEPECGVAELIRVVEELERLAETGAFISLYRSGLAGGERQALPDSPSPEVIRELARRRASKLLGEAGRKSSVEQDTLQRLTARLAGLDTPGGF